jgi:hypothetical protein
MFERLKGRHISLDCHNNFWNISINYKVYMLKAWHKSIMFSHVQNIQTLILENLCFKQPFFSTKCAPFLRNIGNDFNIDD